MEAQAGSDEERGRVDTKCALAFARRRGRALEHVFAQEYNRHDGQYAAIEGRIGRLHIRF